jgi:DNA-binding PadR family transcriptional regulator
MISFKRLAQYPAGSTLVSEDIIEFHASRILLILRICGQKDQIRKIYKISGLTKLAKLDFFVRYPEFFRRYLRKQNIQTIDLLNHVGGIESRMIRFHYGPWDQRYYQLLPFLEARDLITVEKDKGTFTFFLTEKGEQMADDLKSTDEFESLSNNIKNVNLVLGKMVGSKLKNLVYEMFETEVTNKSMGTII